jgi:hypothetical protein
MTSWSAFSSCWRGRTGRRWSTTRICSRPCARRRWRATRIKGLIERIIEEGVSTGAFQPRDREVAPANVLDACFRFVHPVALAVEAETPQSQFDLRLATLVRLVLRGLATGAI